MNQGWKATFCAVLAAFASLAAVTVLHFYAESAGLKGGIAFLFLLPIWIGTRMSGTRAGLITSVATAGTWTWINDASLLTFFVSALLMTMVMAGSNIVVQRFSRARRLASHDPLTGLHNRRSALELGRHIAENHQLDAKDLAVITIDCDGFKGINDQFGHATGDRALKAIGQAIQRACRESDIACRLGGDEFLVILPGADQLFAHRFVGRVRNAIERLDIGIASRLEISAGIANLGRDGKTIDELMTRSDERMYRHRYLARHYATVDTMTPSRT